MNQLCKNFEDGWKTYKIDAHSETISKGLFAHVCMALDITKPLKMELNIGEIVCSILVC